MRIEKIEIFSRENCDACEVWKPRITEICRTHNVRCEVTDIDKKTSAKEYLRILGLQCLPVTAITLENGENELLEGCFSKEFFVNKIEKLALL